MIRILHIVTHMNRGGLESMIMNYYRNIDRTEMQFDFLVHRDHRADYDDEIESMGGIIYRLPPLNPFSPKYCKALNAFFREHREYKIVHSHLDCLSAIPLKAAKENGVPFCIAHSHSTNQDHNIKYLLKLYYKRKIAEYADKLFACGEEAGNWMFCGAKFHVLNNAIDATAYVFDEKKRQQQRVKWGFLNNVTVYGHVGRFSPAKNHVFLIDIFNEIVKKESNSVLLLVGNDKEEKAPEIKEKVRSLGLEDKVIFAGLRSDVADLLQAMDVFVFPSNYEGVPVTMIEAQASGLPCLISDKVPIECKKTDLVQQIALSEGVEVWADRAISASITKRRNTVEEIKEAGFDIGANAKWLQEYYIEKASQV